MLLLILRPKRATLAAVTCIVAQPFLRLAVFAFCPSYRSYLPDSFELVCDALATGCLLALVRSAAHRWAPYVRIVGSAATPAVAVLFCLSAYHIKGSHEVIWYLAAIPLANFSIALLIDHCITEKNVLTGVLNLRWISFAGTLSYSLYLWQEVFLVQGRWTSQPWHWFPVSWALAFAAAYCSYCFVERPFLRLRETLQGCPRKTASLGVPVPSVPAHPELLPS